MNVPKELVTPILEQHAKLASEEQRIWTLSLEPKTELWTMTDLRDTVSQFQSLGYKEEVYDEELCVYQPEEGRMLQVRGIHPISMYCHTDNVLSSQGIWYKHFQVENTYLPDIFSFKVSSQVVEHKQLEPSESNVMLGWDQMMKTYEIRKRIMYTDTHTNVRYNLHMTKRSSAPAMTMVESKVTRATPVIEYSIQCPATLNTKDVIMSLVRMFQLLEQNQTPLTLDQQRKVLIGYDSLVDKVRNRKYNYDRYYLAPKPLTLEQIHLSDPGITYGQLTILDGYAVTDKADGERMLLYVDDTGATYLINNAFEVRGTGIRANKKDIYNTLLDGEFLSPSKRLDKVRRDLFAIFDVYFVGGNSVMHLPLVSSKGESRVDRMNSVIQSSMWEHDKNTSMELRVKQHIPAQGVEMFAACRKILQDAMREGSPYDIDGLVFTPTDLPVLGYYPNQDVKIRSMSSTWDRVFKWKPPEQNSIDFHVSRDPSGMLIKDTHHREYAKFVLSCGYSSLKNKEISVYEGLRLLQMPVKNREMRDTYDLKIFTPAYKHELGIQFAYVPCDAQGVPRAENGDEIKSDSIVEFWYEKHSDKPISYRWRPLRVRNDKMRNTVPITSDISSKRDQRQIKTIKANDWKTATSIWKSIHEPVTKEMITGSARPPQILKEAMKLETRLLGTDDVYYGRNVTREHLLSVEMLNFHNSVIKNKLYKWKQDSRYGSGKNLLELACGMAGDMNRWRDIKTGFAFTNVLGVDLVRNNITKAVDGAYARVLKNQQDDRHHKLRHERTYQNCVFVIGDCAKPLKTGEASKELDSESEHVLLELYGKKSPRTILKSIPPFAKDGFDLVSCQFAIHYFFETEEKLKGFLANVRENLRPSGLFICTFMDGHAVEKLIQEEGKNGLVEGRKLDGKVVVWAIRRISMGMLDSEEKLEAEVQKGGGSEEITAKNPILKNKREKLILVSVPGKGDCLFISLEIGAYGTEVSPNKDGATMRKIVVDQMRKALSKNDDRAKELYENIVFHLQSISSGTQTDASMDVGMSLLDADVEGTYADKLKGYIEWMSKMKTWGGQIEIQMAIDALQRPVYIYHKVEGRKVAGSYVQGDDLYPNGSPIRIWYNGLNHYEGVQLPTPSAESSTPSSSKAGPSAPPTPSKAARTKTAPSAPAPSSAPASPPAKPAPTPKAFMQLSESEESRFGRLIDVYLENTNRLIPEYLVDFQLLRTYAERYDLELVQDEMFRDTYHRENNHMFPQFDKDLVQQKFSFLNRWAVFRRTNKK